MRLLQFSDIHFTRESEADVFDLNRELQWGVREILAELVPIDGILVCGDVAFSGSPTEYVVAQKFLRDVAAKLDVSADMIFVVPGNHDIDRRSTDSNAQRMLRARLRNGGPEAVDSSLAATCRSPSDGALLLEPLTAFNEFADQYGCRSSAVSPYWDHSVVIGAEYGLAIRGINSALASYVHDNKTDERLVVGTAQCLLEPETDSMYLTMCHHPHSWLLDGEMSEKRLGAHVTVQVTGHTHEHKVCPTKRGVLVRAGALQPSRREEPWDPSFCVIELDVEADQLRVEVQQWRWDPSDFKFVLGALDEEYADLPPEKLDDERRRSIDRANACRLLIHRLSQLSVSDVFLAAQEVGLAVTEEAGVDAHELVRRATSCDQLAALWGSAQKRYGRPETEENPFE